MKKYSLIMFLLIFPILAYSQKPEDFKVVYDVGIETVIKPGTALYPFDKHLYVTGSPNTEQIGNRLIRINLLHETRVYEYKNTKTHPYVNDCASEMLAMMTWLGQENILKSKKNYFIGGEYGYLVFNEEETNVDSITFSHYINAGYTSLSVINSTGDYIYQIKTGIKKIKTETFEVVDSILYEKNSTTRSLFGDMYQSPHDRLFIDENGIMWIPIKNRNYYYIHTFDTKVWDSTSYSIFNIK